MIALLLDKLGVTPRDRVKIEWRGRDSLTRSPGQGKHMIQYLLTLLQRTSQQPASSSKYFHEYVYLVCNTMGT